jgi:hypothetical protein
MAVVVVVVVMAVIVVEIAVLTLVVFVRGRGGGGRRSFVIRPSSLALSWVEGFVFRRWSMVVRLIAHSIAPG